MLPPGTVGVSYTAIATAIGGDGPYTWSASGLPAGLVIHPRTGTISGTPAASGTFTVDLRVTGSGPHAQSASVSLPLTVIPAIVPNPGSS